MLEQLDGEQPDVVEIVEHAPATVGGRLERGLKRRSRRAAGAEDAALCSFWTNGQVRSSRRAARRR